MIYTGYFAKTKKYMEVGLTPVSIAGKSPNFFNGIEWKFFAPSWGIYSKWKNGEICNAEFVNRFIPERLEILNKEELKGKLLTAGDIILLCYEKPGSFCHRHIVADWIEKQFGIKVEEFKV